MARVPRSGSKRVGAQTRLNFRASRRQSELIRAAAELRGKSVTDFVLETACAAAEDALADKQHFVVGPAEWKAFTKALERPARSHARLTRLLNEPSVLERKR